MNLASIRNLDHSDLLVSLRDPFYNLPRPSLRQVAEVDAMLAAMERKPDVFEIGDHAVCETK